MKVIKGQMRLIVFICIALVLSACKTTPAELYQKVDIVLDARCSAIPEAIRHLERAAFEAKTGLSWDLCRGRNNE